VYEPCFTFSLSEWVIFVSKTRMKRLVSLLYSKKTKIKWCNKNKLPVCTHARHGNHGNPCEHPLSGAPLDRVVHTRNKPGQPTREHTYSQSFTSCLYPHPCRPYPCHPYPCLSWKKQLSTQQVPRLDYVNKNNARDVQNGNEWADPWRSSTRCVDHSLCTHDIVGLGQREQNHNTCKIGN
jgi:hypothetical protein